MSNLIYLTMVVGTYTTATSIGIYSFSFNQETGESKYHNEIAVNNPSYLTFSEDGKSIYTVSESTGDNARVNAFSIDSESRQLSFINSQPAMDDGPCYISSKKNNIFIANYDKGSVAAFPINNDGSIAPNRYFEKFEDSSITPARQVSSHLHCIIPTPDNQFMLAVNLGGDCIYSYKLTNDESIISKTEHYKTLIKPGSGPRHLVFAPNGKFAYLITEISGEVIVFSYHSGQLKQLQTISADNNNAKGSGDIQISPDGKFLYSSNRIKGDGIAIFKILETGLLTHVGYQPTGIHPRNFAITPNGKYVLVACRDNNRIEIYSRNSQSGLLNNTGNDISINKPVCIKFSK